MTCPLTWRKGVVVRRCEAEQRIGGVVAVGARRRAGHLRLVAELALQLLARQLERLLCRGSGDRFKPRCSRRHEAPRVWIRQACVEVPGSEADTEL